MEKGHKIMVIASIAIFAIIITFILINFSSITGFISGNGDNKADNKSINFKIGTFAICDEKDGYQHCQDKIFASCNGTLIEVNTSEVECLGLKYNVSNMDLGETYQSPDWKDPRETGFLTAWAVSD